MKICENFGTIVRKWRISFFNAFFDTKSRIEWPVSDTQSKLSFSSVTYVCYTVIKGFQG